MNTHEPLPDGGLIRKLWFGDAPAYCDHLLRLDAESRNRRFAGGVSEDFIRSHAAESLSPDAVLHGFFVDGILRGVSELHPFGARLAGQAEAAFSVETPWQSHGVGSALLERTLLAARNRGIAHLRMSCLADNRRMQQLARKFDAALSFDFGEVVGEVEAPQPTPLSLMRELVSDGHGLASAILDAQSRLLRKGAR